MFLDPCSRPLFLPRTCLPYATLPSPHLPPDAVWRFCLFPLFCHTPILPTSHPMHFRDCWFSTSARLHLPMYVTLPILTTSHPINSFLCVFSLSSPFLQYVTRPFPIHGREFMCLGSSLTRPILPVCHTSFFPISHPLLSSIRRVSLSAVAGRLVPFWRADALVGCGRSRARRLIPPPR